MLALGVQPLFLPLFSVVQSHLCWQAILPEKRTIQDGAGEDVNGREDSDGVIGEGHGNRGSVEFAGQTEAHLKSGERTDESAHRAGDGRAAESAGTRAKEFDVFPTAPSSPGARGRN
jgi:hypothetical protein